MQFTLGYCLMRSALKFPKKTAIVFEGQKITYEQLNSQVNRVANGMMAMGVKKGDKVASLLYNTPELIVIYFAAAKIGAVNVPINFRLVGPEVSYITDQSDSKMIFYDTSFRGIIDSLSSKEQMIKISMGSEKYEDSLEFNKLCRDSNDAEPQVDVLETDLRFIMYTSGTTGVPKGAMFSHKNNLWAALSLIITKKYDHNEVILIVNPLFHMNSYINIISAVFWGNKIVLVKKFDAVEMLELMQNEKVTMCSIVPTICRRLIAAAQIAEYALEKWRYCTCTGAAWSSALKQSFCETFPNVLAADAYGATEVMSGTLLEGKDLIRKPNSVGRPYLDTIIKILDGNGNELPANQVGEIAMFGPHVTLGYYKMSKETSEALHEGWFHSGDLGFFDDDGYLYFLDRRKDMIVSGGENIYTAEIEKVLIGHPKIRDVAITGEPDDEWGQVVKALVVLEENQAMSAQEIIAYCKEHLASYKKPHYVEFVESLPKNALGKVLKRKL